MTKIRHALAAQRAQQLLVRVGQKAAPVDVRAIAVALKVEVREGAYNGQGSLAGAFWRPRCGEPDRIGLNESQPEERRRFALAHMLGHLQLHPKLEFRLDKQLWLRSDEPECAEANLFACELLIAWRYQVATQDPEPLPQALAVVPELVQLGHPIVLVTSRPRELEPPTRAWVARRFPLLAACELVMRERGQAQLLSGDLRCAQVAHARARHPGPAVLLDDRPPRLRERGMRVLTAPDGWGELLAALNGAVDSLNGNAV